MTCAILEKFSLCQDQFIENVRQLGGKEQECLYNQLEKIDLRIFNLQQAALKDHLENTVGQGSCDYFPLKNYACAGSEELKEYGAKLIKEGKVGCLLVAGGQGTRLNFDGPKGSFLVSAIRSKSLFQIFAEKVFAASQQAKRLLPLAIMTSNGNDTSTKSFFAKNENFGLKDEQLIFFTQKDLPFLSDSNQLMLEEGQIRTGPDGNGYALHHFEQSGIAKKWREEGIEHVNFILVDNPLADPYDPELVGFQAKKGIEIAIKCVERVSPSESVGVVVDTDQGVRVVEYSEMAPNERSKTLPGGALKHLCTNISLFCFNMNFIESSINNELPLHLAYKSTGKNGLKGWKFETFIFDIFPAAKRIEALMYKRSQCFSPLKNPSGENSPKTVEESLICRDISVLSQFVNPANIKEPIEIDQQFYYPTKELIEKWQGANQELTGYIEA